MSEYAAPQNFIFVDLETTGLDPRADLILAIGLIVTDNGFKELGRFETVIGRPEQTLGSRCSDYTQAMHKKSGLWGKVIESRVSPTTAEVSSRAFLQSILGPPSAEIKERPPYAGNSVHFDKAFIEYAMPSLAGHFNYRCLDVSTLKVLAMATLRGAVEWDAEVGDPAHTPLKDLEGSLCELAHWRRELRLRDNVVSR